MSARSAGYLRERFPNIYAECLRFGIDMTREPIPVVPAAHYYVRRRADRSRRAQQPPRAVGDRRERLHRAARRQPAGFELAARGPGLRRRAALALLQDATPAPAIDPPSWDVGEAAPSDEAVVVSHNWDEVRRCMWNYVGIVRSDKRLERAARRIALLKDEIHEYYWKHLVTLDLLELRNIADLAEVIVRCARFRKESRGLHYTLDHRETDDQRFRGDTVLSRQQGPRLCPIPGS